MKISMIKNCKHYNPVEWFEERHWVFILALCGYVITWYLQLSYRRSELGAIRFEFLYAFALIATSLFLRKNFSNPLLKYLLIFFFFLIIMVPFSKNVDYSWQVFYNRVIKFGFMAYFIIVFVKSPRDLKWFISAFLLACLKMGQEGLFGVMTGGLMWQNQGIMRLHGPTPLYAHPNSFSGMALGTLPFIFYYFPLVRVYIKVILGVLAALAGNIVLYTGSRTGYVAFIVFLFFSYLQSNIKKKLFLIGVPLLIVGSFYIPQQYVERFDSIFTMKEKEGNSAEARIQILKDAVQVYAKYPLGVGVSAFPTVRRQMFGRIQDTHNLYLEVLTNLGIQGFIAFFLFVFMMLNLLRKLRDRFAEWIKLLEESLEQKNGDSEEMEVDENTSQLLADLKFLKATSQAVFMFVIIRLALGVFGMDLYEIYWWFAFGLASALWNIKSVLSQKLEEAYEKNNS